MWGADYVKNYAYILTGSPTDGMAKSGKDEKQNQYP